ncbi:MAG: CoA transferase [Dehalococcoidia bacterium]
MRVIELSDREDAAAYAGKLFARWGAEVVRAESPRRAPAERADDLYLHGGKQRIALDRERPDAADRLRALLGTADILLTDLPARDVIALGLMSPEGPDDPLVRLSITPFGLDGPYRDDEATPATLLALGGYTYLSGDPGRAPLTFPGRYPHYQAGNFAYVAALAAYLHRASGGRPEPIELSVLEVVATLHQFTDVLWTHQERVRSRHGNRWQNLCPTTMLPVADGFAAVNVIVSFWESFTHMLGRPELATDPEWATDVERMKRYDRMDAMMAEAFGDWTRERFLTEGQEVWRVPVGTVLTVPEMVANPHLDARAFWRPIEGTDLRTVGSPFRFVGEEPPVERSPHAPASDEAPEGAPPPAPPAGLAGRTGHRPLEGLRIVDLTRIWSGPLATRILGDLGADVMKIEAPTGRGPAVVPKTDPLYFAEGDPGDRPWNRNGLNNKLNRNKRSLAIDLKAPEGRNALLRLVAASDIVVENFSARAMPSLGLGYEELRAANPAIIYVAMPAFGLEGPYRDYVGLGPSIEPLTGTTALMGYGPDEPRMSVQAITDAMSGTAAAVAILTALERRARTGEGAFVELSQHEAGITFIGEQVIEYQLTGHVPERQGNAHPRLAPHGVYRCAGEDEWIALAVQDDDQWRALCAFAGAGWEQQPEFARIEDRLIHRDALDATVEAWTATQKKQALMRALQALGIAAGAVNAAPDWLEDPQLLERAYFFETEELDTGHRRYDGLPLRFGGRRGYDEWLRSPGLGEHNRAILEDVAGLAAVEVDTLAAAGIIVDRPPA